MKRTRVGFLAIITCLVVLLACPALAQADTTQIVSVSTDGTQGDHDSNYPSISADGSIVAFSSSASTLVDSDTNPREDVFVRDLGAGTTSLVSVSSGGIQGDDSSLLPSISADGLIVAFMSEATNLADGAGNGYFDIFVKYRRTGITELVSVGLPDTGGNPCPSDGDSWAPSISADGSRVAFASLATNLVEGDLNGYADIFVRDLVAQTTTLASVKPDGSPSAGSPLDDVFTNPATPIKPVSISGNGNSVAFSSYAADLVGGADGPDYSDVFVRDLGAETTTLASVDSNELPADSHSLAPSICADGSRVAFFSYANNLAEEDMKSTGDVFIRDLEATTTELVNVSNDGKPGNQGGLHPCISADGSSVAFASISDNLVEIPVIFGSVNVFVRDLDAQSTRLVSMSSNGTPGNLVSIYPSINADGLYVAYVSRATNLVYGDANGRADIFVTGPDPEAASGPTRYEQDHERIFYAGDWAAGENEQHSGGSIFSTDDPEASLIITFRGTRLDWIAAMGPLMGQVWVSIDGGEPILVDLYSDTELFQQVVWSTGTLAYGVHTIKIYYPEDFEPSEIKPINIDAVDVWGALLETTES